MPISLAKINHKTFLINLLFSFIPISFIAGNLILNINILLFIIFAIFFYGKGVFSLKLDRLDKIILIFFAYTIFIGFLNNFYLQATLMDGDYTIAIKTILYLRFLIFYFVIKFLINKNLINFKLFFIFCFICTYFVSLDLMYQLNSGKDVFGYVSADPRRYAGPFGTEFIAGSYLQRFALFALFLFPIFFNNKDKIYLYLLSLLTFILIMTGLIVAGNRVPLILFIILIACILFFYKPMKKFLFLFFLLNIIVFTTLWNFNPNIKSHLNAFTERMSEIVEFASTVIIKNKESNYEVDKDNIIEYYKYSIYVNGKVIPLKNIYIKEFYSGYRTWSENKYFGGGIKSFRYNCASFNCSSHPHNYYLEILSELGLVGFFLILIVFFKVLFNSFLNLEAKKHPLNYDKIIIPFMFLFFIEIFPIKSTGSFFTTGNATYLFLIMSITIALTPTSKGKI